MASANNLCKKVLNVKSAIVESHDFYTDADGVNHLRIKARPNAWHKDDCPHCGRRCAGYDTAAAKPKVWRALDWGALLVEIECPTHRIVCPEHGVVTAAVPWAYPGSSFTKEFDLTVAWLAEYLPRSAVANFMRIDWQTVGNCISRSLHDLEQERSKRLDGKCKINSALKKPVNVIVIILQHSRVFSMHYFTLRLRIKPSKRGRPRLDDETAAAVQAARKEATEIKRSTYSLGKAPEHLTESQKIRLEMIKVNDPQLYRAYRMKESLRLLLKSTSVQQAEVDLKRWLWWASHSRIPAFHALYKKIKGHKKHILNTIRLGLSNARIEVRRPITKSS